MALRSFTEGYVINRGPLTPNECEESARQLQSFMDGFTSRWHDGDLDSKKETEPESRKADR